MITIRASEERGQTKTNWLESNHTFSFNDYHSPEYIRFHTLRVINEDRIIGGAGFDTHSHKNMEIITYVMEGILAHKDSSGGSGIISSGDVQRMSAGKGVAHSEYNNSQFDPVHLLQIWILPKLKDLSPSYEQRHFTLNDKENRLCLIASPDGRESSVTIQQDVDVYSSLLGSKQKISFDLQSNHSAWVQVVKGNLDINETHLKSGDGAAISNEKSLEFFSSTASEFLFFKFN